MEGMGSQFLTIIRAIIFCEFHGLAFVYTKPDWSSVYSKNEADIINNTINIESLFRINDGSAHIISHAITYPFVDSNIDICLQSNSMHKIKQIMKRYNPFSEGFHVVLHVRRPSTNTNIDIPEFVGDVKNIVDFSNDQTERYTSDRYFLEHITNIRKTHPGAIIHVISDGNPDIFNSFESAGVILHINNSVIDAFMMMVHADILVTSRSTFSYTAAHFNENKVIYLKCWHSPSSNWIRTS